MGNLFNFKFENLGASKTVAAETFDLNYKFGFSCQILTYFCLFKLDFLSTTGRMAQQIVADTLSEYFPDVKVLWCIGNNDVEPDYFLEVF